MERDKAICYFRASNLLGRCRPCDGRGIARMFQGVVRHATVGAGGAPTAWTTLNRGPEGDARASSANSLREGFLGDYQYSVATNTYGAAVWTDDRNAADCPAIDAYRASLLTTSPLPKPAPGTACPATFGNTDIYGGSYTAP